jgi:hypothetical protein
MSVPEESIGDILSGKAPVEVEKVETPVETKTTDVKAATSAAEPVEASEKVEKERARDESGKFSKAEAKVEAKEEKTRPDVAAIIDERRKRQAAEARIRELEGKQGQRPSVLEDEDKAFSHRIDEGTRGLREQNFNMSVKLARIQHGDNFEEARAAFEQAAMQDDRLIEALRASADPGDYIYTVGLQIKELADVGGDFVKYREKVTADSTKQIAERDARIKALEVELEATKKAKADLESLPTSLNSKGSQTSSKDVGDEESLQTLVRFGNKQR